MRSENGFAEIRRYEGLAPAMLDLQAGRIDGYISDIPALLYYTKDKPDLKVVERIETGEKYSMMFAKDAELASRGERRADGAEGRGRYGRVCTKSGSARLRRTRPPRRPFCRCRRSTELAGPASRRPASRQAMDIFDTFFNLEVLARTWPLLMRGLWVTAAAWRGLDRGGAGRSACWWPCTRLYAPAFVRVACRAYIDIFRSIPLLVLLIIVYYALPFVGLRLSPFASAMAALTLVSGAYTAEIFRAGIEAVPKGQFEASAALGLTPLQTMIDVILPQAVRIVIPPLTNNSINVVKDTALASVVAMPDLLKQATQAQALAANPSPLIGAAAIYILFLWPFVALVSRMERRFAAGRR